MFYKKHGTLFLIAILLYNEKEICQEIFEKICLNSDELESITIFISISYKTSKMYKKINKKDLFFYVGRDARTPKSIDFLKVAVL